MDAVDSLSKIGGPRVFEALQDLSSHHKLKKLAVRGVETETVRLLGAMVSSSITDLSLSYHFDMDSPDPFSALQSLGSTLTTLDLEWADPESLTLQCPLLHTLSLFAHCPVTTPVRTRLPKPPSIHHLQ